MKYEQRHKSEPYYETVKQRFPHATPKFIKLLINIQNGKVRP